MQSDPGLPYIYANKNRFDGLVMAQFNRRTVQQLVGFLHKQSKTNDVQKKRVIMELRDNLNLFKEALQLPISYDELIDLLSNDAYRNAVKVSSL
jgi:hypothetical protein